VGQFLAHLEQQIEFAKFEIDRLRQRKAAFERALARVEEYVIQTRIWEPIAKGSTVSWKEKPRRSACGGVRRRWKLPTSQPFHPHTRRCC
jgi:hypothetical protein